MQRLSKRIVHFIDSTSALACIVRGFSQKPDLAAIAGRLWFELSGFHCHYRAEYVTSGSNLADGPSRGDFGYMREIGADVVPKFAWPKFGCDFDSWMSSADSFDRAVVDM